MPDRESLGDIALQERIAFEAVFGTREAAALLSTTEEPAEPVAQQPRGARLIDSPREVEFFSLIHSELRKTSWFFGKTEAEFALREEQMQASVYLSRSQTARLAPVQRALLLNGIQRLHHDLLLLETYAIVTYCAFSKILKKHDKITGYPTWTAFMSTFVNKANFATYPRLAAMIRRCDQLHREYSTAETGEPSSDAVVRVPLQEDELLFVNMVQQLHHEASQTAIEEGRVVAESGEASSVVARENSRG